MLSSIPFVFFFFSSRRRHTRSLCDWSSDVCSSDLGAQKKSPATSEAHHAHKNPSFHTYVPEDVWRSHQLPPYWLHQIPPPLHQVSHRSKPRQSTPTLLEQTGLRSPTVPAVSLPFPSRRESPVKSCDI